MSVFRFAPSPTGRLHRGHAFSLLTAWRASRAQDGAFRLRIENIDRTRCRPEFEDGLLEDIAWLGVTWDGPALRQSERSLAYEAAIQRLAFEDLIYRCFRTRREVAEAMTRAPHSDEPAFFGERLSSREERRRLDDGEPFAWRLDVRAAAARVGALTFLETGQGPGGETGLRTVNPQIAGDIVLARKDIGVAYHLAVVVDDAFQGVTHVVRGRDLFGATGVQRLLQTVLDVPEPVYRHHRLLVGPDGKRYAKRDRAETLQAIRERGLSPDQLIAELELDGSP
ncbi:MAG: tRNA glutamyl-Q(34) synthetase GluQRS [Phenylobacterium sp.]